MKPSRRLLWLLAGLLATALGLGAAQALDWPLAAGLPVAWWQLLALLVLAAGLDAWRVARMPAPRANRQLPAQLSLGRWHSFTLQLESTYTQTCHLSLYDHLPPSLEQHGLPERLQLEPGQHLHLSYSVRPLQRGHVALQRCEAWLLSPWQLWHSRRYLECPAQTRVYPDFARLLDASISGLDSWLKQIGIRQRQRRGLGTEFHQLREFRPGDTLRQIDWKATARKRQPVSREYQDEQDQQILFLLDCGRRMHSQDDDLSHFDHALDACLLLAYVALRQGDAVGLQTFAHDQPRFLPPAKGQAQLSALLKGVYDVQTTTQPADFTQAVSQLLSRQKRRALVVVVSNLRDEDNRELSSAMQRLGRHHRVLIASLREEVLDRLRQQTVDSYQQALDYCGTLDYLRNRARQYDHLTAHHLPVLECRPDELGPRLVSQYLQWKKAGTL